MSGSFISHNIMRYIKLFPFLLLSLACMSTLPPLATMPPADTGTPIPSAAVQYTPRVEPTSTPNTCLVVIATESLHLRSEPTVHSAALAWLANGKTVMALALEDGWWFVDTGEKQGYVKADFVELCDVQPKPDRKRR